MKDGTSWLVTIHPMVGAFIAAIVVVIVVLAFAVFVNAMDIGGANALRTECLQYETIGDMPAKCLDLFD